MEYSNILSGLMPPEQVRVVNESEHWYDKGYNKGQEDKEKELAYYPGKPQWLDADITRYLSQGPCHLAVIKTTTTGAVIYRLYTRNGDALPCLFWHTVKEAEAFGPFSTFEEADKNLSEYLKSHAR